MNVGDRVQDGEWGVVGTVTRLVTFLGRDLVEVQWDQSLIPVDEVHLFVGDGESGGQRPVSPAGRDAGSAPADAMASPRPGADPVGPVPELYTGPLPTLKQRWVGWLNPRTGVLHKRTFGAHPGPDWLRLYTDVVTEDMHD